jgi:hypothetical protein
MDHLDLGASNDGNLDDPEEHDQDHRHHQSELHDGTPSLSHHPIPFATEITFCITVLKNDGSMSVVDAHVMRASATIAAATRTSAYSAVA